MCKRISQRNKSNNYQCNDLSKPSPLKQYSTFFTYLNNSIKKDGHYKGLDLIDNCLAKGELWEQLPNEKKMSYELWNFNPDDFQTNYLKITRDSKACNNVKIISLDELLPKDAFLVSNENQQEFLNEEEEFDDSITIPTNLKLDRNKQQSTSDIESLFNSSVQIQNPFIKKEQVNYAAHKMQQKLEVWTQILQQYQKQ